MEIAKFQPIRFKNKALDLDDLNKKTQVSWRYSSSGKSALYHCLKSLCVSGVVLVPVYVCSSILTPLKELGLDYVFYDLDKFDLNASLEDIQKKLETFDISCVLVASMYGTPAKLEEIFQLCKEHDVYMVDDAAQSFGSVYKGKYVGTFGDAGFFSFSPGKATPGHLGAFFWTKNEKYLVKYKNNYLLHKIAYWDYFFNRYHIYRYKRNYFFLFFKYLNYFCLRFFDYKRSGINSFEKSILGGIIEANFSQSFRRNYLNIINEAFDDNLDFRLITKAHKNEIYFCNNHKIVLLCKNRFYASSLSVYLKRKNIYSSLGYPLLSNGLDCPNAKDIEGRVLEIPLEECREKVDYIVDSLRDFIS